MYSIYFSLITNVFLLADEEFHVETDDEEEIFQLQVREYILE